MIQALCNSCYTYEEARQVYLDTCAEPDLSLLTPYNYRRMGFKTFSHCMVKGYPSLEEYYRTTMIERDVYPLKDISQRFAMDSALTQCWAN